MASDFRPVRRALLSVSDKSGLADLARHLATAGVEILASGGTAKAINEAGVPCREVSDYTGFPEILDGRVKTLHPKIHGAILGKPDNPAHAAEMRAHGIGAIDLVAVNLYPFAATLASGAGRAACIENIDVGGPAMIRAAAKNHGSVAVVVDPADYGAVIAEMQANSAAGGRGAIGGVLRARLAVKAFAHTAAYDAAIAGWLAAEGGEPFPEHLALVATRVHTLRYGENPHQGAAVYRAGAAGGTVVGAKQAQGKELSYNNLNDADAALELVAEFDQQPAVAIIKHANPCGVAVAATLADAWRLALASDPQSAFGGVVACNRALDEATAKLIAEIFTEVIIAPTADDAALAVLAAKKNLRLLLTGRMPDPRAPGLVVKSVGGGYLAQTRDTGRIDRAQLKVVSKRQPTAAELADFAFADRVCKHVKSNAIVCVKDGATIGIGAGQQSRVDAAKIAAEKAGARATGAVAASDAFFPFADGVEVLAQAGVAAIVQPGGSVRDAEVIAAADRLGLAMAFTGLRHFRH
jgi:phosphoribosylaminoimidazolecarboxamide formyltransferase / IMP cyclohydrolase